MQKGQMSANLASSLMMSADISCLLVSTTGTRNFLPQLLQATDFWATGKLLQPAIWFLN
jgi:hypothetical protein